MELSDLQAVLNKEFQEPMSDLVARSNPMLAGLTKRALATDRIWLRHKSASDHNARTVLDGAAVTIGDPSSERRAGVLDWSTYISEFKLPKRLLGQVQNNPAMIGQLFQDEIQDAAKDLADKIAADLGGGDSVNGLSGLQSVFGAANTYAGINRATAGNEYWHGLNVNAAAADLSTSIFYDAEEEWFKRNFTGLFDGEVPAIFTTKRVQRKYKELFEQISYDALSTAHFVNQANAGNQFGKSGVAFQGAPIIPDRNIVSASTDTGYNANPALSTTDRLYIVKPNALFLAFLEPNDDPEVVRMQQISASKAPTAENIRVQIEILGNTGESVQGYVKTYIQLVCEKPPEAGVLIRNVTNAL